MKNRNRKSFEINRRSRLLKRSREEATVTRVVLCILHIDVIGLFISSVL